MEYAQHIHLSTLIYTLTNTHTPTDMHRALEQRIPITRILSICLLSIIYLAEAIGIHVQLNATNDGIKWQFSLKISLKMVNRKRLLISQLVNAKNIYMFFSLNSIIIFFLSLFFSLSQSVYSVTKKMYWIDFTMMITG